MDSRVTGRWAPSEVNRLAARQAPVGAAVMYQRWRDLLFLHWEYPQERLQATLPAGLHVDTYQGKAYLGVVPFFMQGVRPRGLPAVPGISNFMELNLRTYVYDQSGVPGVWFYSLEANQRLAVAIARRFFHLPYVFARMTAGRSPSGAINYRAQRPGGCAHPRPCAFEYAAGPVLRRPEVDSLEFFLVERYRLFASANGRLWSGSVWHPPYPLHRAAVTIWDENLLALNGFEPTGRPPDHAVGSRGVDVALYPLRRIQN